MKDKNIFVKENEDGLCLFKYFINADFSDPIVLEARGIIIDLNTLNVVCWPFNKFFNQHEFYAAEIDWNNCRVQDKKDGSIVKLYWWNNKWNWATNGVIYAQDATIEDFKHNNFLELIQDAYNYRDIDYSVLNKDYTYIFEVVDPIMHPIKYEKVALWHIGTRNNITGEELVTDIGIQKPEEYDLHSLKEVINFVQTMNSEKVTQEGVVVVDKNWNRIKIKNLTYLQLHYLNSGIIRNKTKILELLSSDDIDIKTLIDRFPQYQNIFDFYTKQLEDLEVNLQIYINHVREMYINFGRDRKKIADIIKDDKWKHFGFKSLNSSSSAKVMLSELRIKNITAFADLIEDYKE